MEIVKETKKALMIEVEGLKFWIQRRWLRSDGSLTPAGEKARQKALEAAAERAKGEKYYAVAIARETAKAVAVQVELDAYTLERDMRRLVWFPKSVMRDNRVPAWLLHRKLDELTLEGQRFGGWLVVSKFEDYVYV